jgi:hypothetical protein
MENKTFYIPYGWVIMVKTSESRTSSFFRQKQKLREFYKRWKVGAITWEEIPGDYQILLQKYYGAGP